MTHSSVKNPKHRGKWRRYDQSKTSASGRAAGWQRLSAWGMEAHLGVPIVAAVLLAVIWIATFTLADVERSGARRDAVISTS